MELSIFLSFVISYIVNCLPTHIYDKLSSISEGLKKCYNDAVCDWNVDDGTKQVALDNMDQRIEELNDYITGKKRGRHPKENELLKLWAEKIMLNPQCNSFIIDSKINYLQLITDKGFSNVINKIDEQLLAILKVAEKVNHLYNRGVFPIDTYWKRWSIGPNGLSLNYNIVLAGRETESSYIKDICKKPDALCVESSSRSDALAFVVATILESQPKDIARCYVVESDELFRDLSDEKTPLILITTVQENMYYPVSNGHGVILCTAKEDKYQGGNKVSLPIVDRDGFLKSLEESAISTDEALKLSRESHRESSALRRLLGININKPSWENVENLRYVIPALLIGSWDSSYASDKEIVNAISGMDYMEFEKGVNELLFTDESPLIKTLTIWKIKSPKLIMSQLYDDICEEQISKYKNVLDWIFEDDDPDAKKKKEEKDLRFWNDNRLYSASLRNGVVQALALLAVVGEEKGGSSRWIEDLLREKFKNFDVHRYLSNRNNLILMAEASPSAFIDYIVNDIKKGSPVINELFKIERKQFGIGTEIYFMELLASLECLAWDEDYLQQTTNLLFVFCDYSNDSNYINKPIASLYNIYRFLWPQTLVCFEKRFEILSKMIKKHRKTTCSLLLMMLDGIKNPALQTNSQFRWRYGYKIKTSKTSTISNENIKAVTTLLLDNIDMTEDNVCKIIEISSAKYMRCSRTIIFKKLNEVFSTMKGDEKIFDCIQKEIEIHKRCNSAVWALSEEELNEYKKLQDALAIDDVVIKNKKYFEKQFIKDPDLNNFEEDYLKMIEESRAIRTKVISSIFNQKGDDGIWEMANVAGYKDCVAMALADFIGDGYISKVYTLYCQKKLDHRFVCRYYAELYQKNGCDKYIEYVNQLKGIDLSAIAMILYAPGADPVLWSLVETMPKEIQQEYWSKVQIYRYVKDDLAYIIDHMRMANRYADILLMLDRTDISDELSNKQKLGILFEMMDKGAYQIIEKNIYNIARILKFVNVPSTQEEKYKLLLLEVMLFDRLRHYMDSADIHLLSTIGKEPELMIELVSMAFLEDEENRTVESPTEAERNFAICAYNVLYNYHGVPGMQSDGSINYEFLKSYIKELYQLAQQMHRTNVISIIVGKILGNIPENDDYPSDALCEIVEELNDDKVDNEIGCCLSNRRGSTIRGPFDGGLIEREYIDTFKGYKKKAILLSPRLVKIFDNEISFYESIAQKMDQEAKLNDLRD